MDSARFGSRALVTIAIASSSELGDYRMRRDEATQGAQDAVRFHVRAPTSPTTPTTKGRFRRFSIAGHREIRKNLPWSTHRKAKSVDDSIELIEQLAMLNAAE